MVTKVFTDASTTTVLNSLKFPLIIIDQKGLISFANQAWIEQIVQTSSSQDYLGESYLASCEQLQNLSVQDANQCKQAIQEVLQKQRKNYQLDYQLCQEKAQWYRMSVSTLDDGALIVHEDISDLKQAETQAELLLESPLDAMLLIDAEGHIQLSNKRLEQLFGYSRDELFGQGLETLIPHRFRRQHRGHLKAYFGNPEMRPMGVNLELFALTKEGREFPIEISLNPIQIGESFLVSAALRDVSVQKQTEAELSRLGRIIEDSINEVFLFDAHTLRFVFVNEGAQRNLGYDEEELEHLTPLDIKPDYDFASFEALLNPLRTGEKEALQFAAIHQRRDGSSYPVDIHLQLFKNENPAVFCAVIMDVSERLKAEKELKESQHRMAKHLQDTPLAVVEWRVSDKRITTWNPAAERLFGYTQKEALSKLTANSIVPEESKTQLADIWNGTIKDEGARSANRNLAKDGSLLMCEWYNTVIKDANGDVQGVAALGLDVTMRQRALESLLSAQEEERARISRDLHDQVGQSLTGLVLGMSNAMGKKSATDLNHFKQQTEDILADVRRISRDLRPALLDELGLEPAVNRLVRDLQELSGLEIDVLMRLPKNLQKDQQTVIYRVVQESLTNISRHAEARNASVTVTSQNGQIQLVIEDDGKGFEPNSVAVTEHVGLAGMRERIELAGGTLTIESSLGQGTTVSARLMQST